MTSDRILVVGGTRFAGRALVRQLAAAGATVTVVSRRAAEGPGIGSLVGDRDAMLPRLSGQRFDAVVDFLAFRHGDVVRLVQQIDSALYIIVSSAWMTRLSPGCGAADPIGAFAPEARDALPPRTFAYLAGKAEVEHEILELHRAGHAVVAVRPPIIWGRDDHTGRLAFYARRVSDGGGLLLVEGGNNRAQIVWSEDVARTLVAALAGRVVATRPIWDMLPDDGIPVHGWARTIATALGRPARLVPVPRSLLTARLPVYLDAEPLWRECALPRSPHNLFAATATEPTPVARWLAESVTLPDARDPLRAAELSLIAALAAGEARAEWPGHG